MMNNRIFKTKMMKNYKNFYKKQTNQMKMMKNNINN